MYRWIIFILLGGCVSVLHQREPTSSMEHALNLSFSFYDDIVTTGDRRIIYSVAYPDSCSKVISKEELFFAGQRTATEQFVNLMYDFVHTLDSNGLLKTPERPEYITSRISSFTVPSLPFCRVSPDSEPNHDRIIFYSPGWGLPRWGNYHQVAALTSRGFTVVVIDHPHAGFPNTMVYDDGSIVSAPPIPFSEIIKSIDQIYLQTRVSDLTAVIRKVCAKRPCKNIGLLGYSVGGATAGMALATHPQVKAAVNIDGTMLWNDAHYSSAKQPFLFIYTDPPSGERKAEIESLTPIFPNTEINFFANMHHLEFLSLTLDAAPIIPSTQDPALIHKRLNTKLIDFFETYL